jgi:cystathionine beta-lyase
MKQDTKVVSAGRHPEDYQGAVNPPVYRFSTITFPSVEELLSINNSNKYDKIFYGRLGTPTTSALEEAVAELEGGTRCIVAPSGVAAITISLTAFLQAGDHLLMTQNAYHAVIEFCDEVLKGYGIETSYYDPLIGEGIESLIRPNTRVVFCESPGSNSFEVQDIPAIAKVAHRHDCVVMADNTWATPLFFKPLSKGVDVSILAGTKYIVGHSDAMLGTITVANHEHFLRIKDCSARFGFTVGSEEAYLGLRGLRTLSVRLRQHMKNAIALAKWLQERPEVERVMYPALADDPGHALWRRDFEGATGLFGVVLKPCTREGVIAMLDDLSHFSLGYSWGGYESLVLPMRSGVFSADYNGEPMDATLRFHVGLEDVADLISDLEKGFERLVSY